MNKDRETQLIIKAKDGDEAAIETLMSQFKQYITTQSYHRTLPGNELEDNLQNVKLDFLEAVENFDFKKGVKFFTYLYSVVFQNHGKRCNELNTHKRKINTKSAISLESKILTGQDLDNAESSLADLIEDPQALEYFNSVETLSQIDNLNKTEYFLIKYVHDGYTIAEISKILGVTSKHLAKIKINLNNKLKNKSHNINDE